MAGRGQRGRFGDRLLQQNANCKSEMPTDKTAHILFNLNNDFFVFVVYGVYNGVVFGFIYYGCMYILKDTWSSWKE